MMHPEMAKLYASQQQATPAEETVIYDLTEFATADEWVEAKGKRGGLVARNKRSGRVLYGSRARAVLSRSRRRGGGGSLFQKRSGFIGDINRKPGLVAGKATGVTRSRTKPAPSPTAKETLGKVLKETPDKPLSGKQVRAEVKDKKATPARGKPKAERRKETAKGGDKDPFKMSVEDLQAEKKRLEGVASAEYWKFSRSSSANAGPPRAEIQRRLADVNAALADKGAGGSKASWQRTQKEMATTAGGSMPAATHRKHVEAALAAGKPVPAEVLADYPDLAGKPGEKEPHEMTLDEYRAKTGHSVRPKEPTPPRPIAKVYGTNGPTLQQAEEYKGLQKKYRADKRQYDKDYKAYLDVVYGANSHRKHVEAALAAGKKVPPEVLADYPDLAQKGA